MKIYCFYLELWIVKSLQCLIRWLYEGSDGDIGDSDNDVGDAGNDDNDNDVGDNDVGDDDSEMTCLINDLGQMQWGSQASQCMMDGQRGSSILREYYSDRFT